MSGHFDAEERDPIEFPPCQGHGMSLEDARAIRDALRRSEIAMWAEKYQDIGFAATITIPGNWRHWFQSGSPCNGLAS